MKYSVLASVLIVIFNIFLIQEGRTILKFYFIEITDYSLIFSITMLLRFLSIVSSFAIFSSIVSLDEQIRILEKLKIPQKAIVSLALSLRFFPVVLEDAKGMMDSLHARGIEFRENKWRKKIAERLPILSSLLMLSLERSINIAESLEIRGFPSENRVRWKEMKLDMRDKMIISIFIFDIFLSVFYLLSAWDIVRIVSPLVPAIVAFGRCRYAEV